VHYVCLCSLVLVWLRHFLSSLSLLHLWLCNNTEEKTGEVDHSSSPSFMKIRLFKERVKCVLGGFHVVDRVVMLVVFIVLMALVKKFAWGPVVDMMEKRERYVADEIDAAEKSRKEAEEASAKAQEQLKQTKQEAQQIIEDAKT